jgi:hypothetical protein
MNLSELIKLLMTLSDIYPSKERTKVTSRWGDLEGWWTGSYRRAKRNGKSGKEKTPGGIE